MYSLNKALSAFDCAVLRQRSENTYELVHNNFPWIFELFNTSTSEASFNFPSRSLFLDDFIEQAKELWETSLDDQLNSGIWTEQLNKDLELHLEAIAINSKDEKLLVLHNQEQQFIQRQTTLQSARELVIANEVLQEQHIHVRRQFEKILLESRSLGDKIEALSDVIDHAQFGVLILDASMRPLLQNPAIFDLFDLPYEPSSTNVFNTLSDLARKQYPEFERVLSVRENWQGELLWMQPPFNTKWLKVTLYVIGDSDPDTYHWCLFVTDISRLKHLQQHNETLALHDPLTQLPNRQFFWRCLERFCANPDVFYVLYIDVNHFKQVNEAFGHKEGDRLLRELANRLKNTLKKKDVIARVGGDEFAIILSDINEPEHCQKIADRMQKNAHDVFTTEGDERYYISLSIGAVSYPNDGKNPETLMKYADLAAYKAKSDENQAVELYSSELTQRSSQRLTLESALRDAVKNDEFELMLQPILNLTSNRVVKAEALIRWNHPERGIIMPGEFIPLAEQTGLIVKIGKWVIEKGLALIQSIQSSGFRIKLSINLSPRQIRDPGLLSFVEKQLEKTDIDPSLLEFELTEGTIVSDYDTVSKLLNLFRQKGISVAIDDFGTGYSSLSYLKKLPIDDLKIDRSFVKDLASDDNDKAIVLAVLAMAKQLQLDVTAEGVEDSSQQQFLNEHDCELGQGYLFSQPVTFDNFISYLRTKN
ncbi:bifunctional diguanylate cyclase/phosphodiesterase [Alteromonadaceae bacterium M269]|nr:bifunctional diguanylate cyclase/phosphodiesterase [Alteromonadaceae bacterium M269]